MISLRPQQPASDAHIFLSSWPSQHNQVGLRLLLDDLIYERGREHYLREAMRKKCIVMAGALDQDMELCLALRRKHDRITLPPVFLAESCDECGQCDVFLERGEWADLS